MCPGGNQLVCMYVYISSMEGTYCDEQLMVFSPTNLTLCSHLHCMLLASMHTFQSPYQACIPSSHHTKHAYLPVTIPNMHTFQSHTKHAVHTFQSPYQVCILSSHHTKHAYLPVTIPSMHTVQSPYQVCILSSHHTKYAYFPVTIPRPYQSPYQACVPSSHHTKHAYLPVTIACIPSSCKLQECCKVLPVK